MKMLAAMLASVFSDEKLSAEDIEKLKQKDVLQSMMEELADYLPAAKEVLIDERDIYLAAQDLPGRREQAWSPSSARGTWRASRRTSPRWPRSRESTDVAPLDELPAKSAGRPHPSLGHPRDHRGPLRARVHPGRVADELGNALALADHPRRACRGGRRYSLSRIR